MEKTIDTINLFIGDNDGKLPYRSRKGEQRTTISWGQRKLMIGEIEFLTYFWNPTKVPKPIVVYAGASPGTHIPLLATMFESVAEWHLYDPRPFKIAGTSKIILHQQLFTDKDATQWANREDIILISDIRTADHTTMKPDENEAAVWTDNLMQQKWLSIMKPIISSLKFRLPYYDVWNDMLKPNSPWLTKLGMTGENPQQLKYLKGLIMYQPWRPSTSTETRLIVSRDDGLVTTTYDLIDYEQILAYHNVIVREQEKYVNIPDDELLKDFDSAVEAFILKQYFYKMIGNDTTSNETILKLSRLITEELNVGRPTRVNLSILRSGENKSARRLTKGS